VALATVPTPDSDDARKKEIDSARLSALNVFQAARKKHLLSKADLAQTEEELEKARKESTARVAAAVLATADCENRRLAAQWPTLNGTWIPSVGLTGFIDTYPAGEGPDPKDTTGQTSADLEPFGGVGVEGSLSFHPHERIGLDLYISYMKARSSGLPHTKLANNVGGGATFSALFFSFLDDSEKYKSPDYVKAGFLPGLGLGASAQIVYCDGREQCAKERPDQRSVTPFFDVRVKPALQFRISVPITSYTSVDKTGTDIQPTLSIAGQIASL